MKNASRSVSLAVVLAISLSGCGVARKLGLAPQRKSDEAEVAQAPRSPLTEIGRSQLGEGNPGLALATFRKALEAGEERAPVFNGQGVAYARIGREDLAAIYFRLAIDADPANERYAANLALLLRSSGVRHLAALDGAVTRTAAAKDDPAEAVLAAAASPDAAAGRLVRLSPREFEIRTVGSDAPAIRAGVGTRADARQALQHRRAASIERR
ncbi:hypothetical protein OLX02_02095 [Novosphingobium sp. KCTC 2891]|uniref:tetratricopeptide repeat protein n=1 Tax=Novosphingobium sp. KCTC 2891 TaxID=2989730 RepID=UPI00222176E8|nr:hypothetical protein [Novosphingobium sp. KCTC 2891]MCW1381605.1 hypothetical protein [Novosphingobium sp. KCTC 2891]